MAQTSVSWTEIKNNFASSLMIQVLFLTVFFLLAALNTISFFKSRLRYLNWHTIIYFGYAAKIAI